MKITQKNLQDAVQEKLISRAQAEKLYQFWAEQTKDSPNFSLNHILYYFGGLIAIAAMTIFADLSLEHFGGAGIVVICLVYAALALCLTHFFASKNHSIPAGICATFVVCLTPLAIYGLQQWLGIWPNNTSLSSYHSAIRWHWLYMEIGTLVVGALVAYRYKYPFLLMPIAFTLWYMSMDITSMLYGENFNWSVRMQVSLYSGLAIIMLAFWLDLKWHKKGDYAFWLYLFGVLAFWGGLTNLESNDELTKFFYFCINLLMIVIGAALARRVFVLFGALGTLLYIGYLAGQLFQDQILFPIALTLIGVGIIYLGILWQKHEKQLTKILRSKLPTQLRELIEK